MNVKRILQLDGTGCGIACVASLAGRSYTEVKKEGIAREILDKGGPYYTECRHLRQLLQAFGFKSWRGRYVSKWTSITGLAIVGINPRKSGNWHWVLYVPTSHGGFVRDPRKAVKRARRTDFEKMRLHSYIPLSHPAAASTATRRKRRARDAGR